MPHVSPGSVLCVLLPLDEPAGELSLGEGSLLEHAVALMRAAVPGCVVITAPLGPDLAYLVDSAGAELVVVHDPTFPFVSVEQIRSVQAAADATDMAAVLVTAVTDTLKQVAEDDRVLATVDRASFQALLGPLVVTPPVLSATLAAVRVDPAPEGRLAALVEALGRLVGVSRVILDEPGAAACRVSSADDLRYAEALLASNASARVASAG